MSKDKQIADIIRSTISWDVRLGVHEVEVTVEDGIVCLLGTVDSYLKRCAAEEDAAKVPGVKKVANDLKVALSTKRPDQEIAHAVKEAFKWDPRISPSDLDVSVKQGVVTLIGTVDNWSAKKVAVVLVEGIAGVKGVRAKIAYFPALARSDEEIQEEVEARLRYDYRSEFGANLAVEVKKGIVTLRGSAQSAAARRAAEETAWDVMGVKQVVNKIVVRL